jgi:hypothetical protein
MGGMGPQKEIRMKGALVATVVAMAFGAASSTMALAQANKEASPGAVTSKSNAAALPTGGSSVQGMQGHTSTMSGGNAGVADTTTKSSEKARN